MKKLANTTLVLTLVILAMVLVPVAAMAQGAPPSTPIDGVLSLLLAAGCIYAVREVRRKRSS